MNSTWRGCGTSATCRAPGWCWSGKRTQLKNRIHVTLAKYALHDLEVTDLFGVRGRTLLRQRFDGLPPHMAYASRQLLEQVEALAAKYASSRGGSKPHSARPRGANRPQPEIDITARAKGYTNEVFADAHVREQEGQTPY